MVTLVKHEWHQVDAQFAYELDMDTLEQIYPDMKKKELKALMKEIESGEYDIDTLVSDAQDNDVEIEWDRQYDDWWTDRKGGYDVTFELGDESSWHHEPEPDPPTHKCTKCKWEGDEYTGNYQREDADGNEFDEVITLCAYCDSPVEMTEFGKKKDEENKARWAKFEKEYAESLEGDPCFSCDKLVQADELITMEGQDICPHCGEGWVNMDFREDDQ